MIFPDHDRSGWRSRALFSGFAQKLCVDPNSVSHRSFFRLIHLLRSAAPSRIKPGAVALVHIEVLVPRWCIDSRRAITRWLFDDITPNLGRRSTHRTSYETRRQSS
ncbi:hypothetical protein R1flu_011538 [Riccia fluitans]|uniref:Uncharacterized protein n=1 Tax=Riccia fluitans TaxID=41844 RepID=A0ABD1Z8G8_9MARC